MCAVYRYRFIYVHIYAKARKDRIDLFLYESKTFLFVRGHFEKMFLYFKCIYFPLFRMERIIESLTSVIK